MNWSLSNFLSRPPPMEGESLSSWRQRSGWKNGYRLYPTPDERARRVDSDIGLQTAVIAWLANSHSLRVEDLNRMTLNGYVGRVVERLDLRDQPRWWLRARYGNSTRPYGPLFCPRCLETDEEAYFRLIWRFGFITSCIKHRCDLLDCCPGCNKTPWPSGLGVKGNLSERFTSFINCWHCGFDLGSAGVNFCSTTLTERLLEGLSSGEVSLGEGSVSILDTLNSLWAASQIFLRKRTRDHLLASDSWQRNVESVSQSAWSERTIEGLRVQDRKVLLDLAWEIIRNKEDSFAKFCKESDLKRFHFDGAMELQPEWMNAVIERELPTRLKPRVEDNKILEFVGNYQLQNGRFPHKYELRKLFGAHSNQVLDNLLTVPDGVLEAKFVEFCEEAKSLLREAQQERTLLFKHCTYDLTALLVSLLETRSLKEVVELTLNEMIYRLRAVEARTDISPNFKDLVRCVLNALEQVVLLNLKPVDHVQLRQVRKRRVTLMKRLKVRSLNDHLVFAKYVKMFSGTG